MASEDDQGAPPPHPAAPILADAYGVGKFYSSRLCYDVARKIKHSIRQREETQELDQLPFILDCCALSIDLENEIIMTFSYVRQAYGRFFPELRSIVDNPIVYVRIVKTIGNTANLDSGLLLPLQAEGVLTPSMVEALVAVRSLTTTRSSRPLRETLEMCDKVLALDSLKKKVVAFVESRIGLHAPNLSALVGMAVAAKLLGAAGGLSELSIMPIPNIVFLGAGSSNNGISGLKKNISVDDDYDDDGLIFTAIHPLPGFYISYGTKSPFKGCYLARQLQSEACRRLGESINLAATMDLAGKDLDWDRMGEKGRAMGEEIRKLTDEWKRKAGEDYAASWLTKKQVERSALIGCDKLAVVKDADKFKLSRGKRHH